VTRELRIVSWNLLRRTGANTGDVGSLIEQYRPDLLLMQEAARELIDLPAIAGGHVYHAPLQGRVYGLAVWSPVPLTPPHVLPLPVSTMPGRVPLRVAQMITVAGISFANVHLSHGQFLNRWQLLYLARSLSGPMAIVGDYNAVGPIRLAGLKDVGPRQPTHVAGRLVPFRLDRCMVQGLNCNGSQVLDRGASDHRPIMVRLCVATEVQPPSWGHKPLEYARYPVDPLPANLRRWLRGLTQGEIWHTARQASGYDTVVSHDRKARSSLKLSGASETVQRGIGSQTIGSPELRSLQSDVR
jgi:endonuclease/exonuclease/phosphatase family metal-dependent hydrolase